MTDVNAMLKALRQERELVDEAIATLEVLGKGKRRGRPPSWLREARKKRSPRRTTRAGSRKPVEP